MASVDPLNLDFKEQLRYFRGKVNTPTNGWRDVWKEEHDHAFMVAGATKADLLQDLRGAVDKAIAEGKTLAWFQENFEEIVAKHGWVYHGTPAWRARVIYETNMLTSYSAGRYAQMTDPKFLALRPYWKWKHSDSVHPRPQHVAWDGMILRADDDFWKSHYPPCGWGCKCKVFALDDDGVKEIGGKVLPQAPKPLMPARPGEVLPGVDEGFDFRQGSTVTDRMRPVLDEKITGYSPKISAALRKDMNAYLAENRNKVADLQRTKAVREVQKTNVVRQKTLEKWLGSPEGNLQVATIPSRLQKALGAKSDVILMSHYTAAKQAGHHSDITASDYLRFLNALSGAEVFQEGDLVLDVLFQGEGDQWFKGVIKTTRDRSEIYLSSMRRVDARGLRRTRELPKA